MPDPRADASAPPSHPSPASEESTATANQWGPYSGASDFGANMAIVLAALFCAAVLGFSLAAAVRFLLRRRRRSRGGPLPPAAPEKLPEAKAAAAVAALPTMVFSAAEAGTRLAGAGPAECAICLTEFAEGDAVRVLPPCSHGFHVRCIERWLEARSSCPTCRARCLVDGEQEQEQEEEEEAAAAAPAPAPQVGAEAV